MIEGAGEGESELVGPESRVGDREMDIHLAAHAARLAERQGFRILDVLAWYAREGKTIKDAPPLSACARHFMCSKVASGRGPDSINGYKSLIGGLVRRFGRKRPSEITTEQVYGFLRRWHDPNTRIGYYWRLHAFFQWLVLQGYALENPIRTGVKPHKTGGRGSFFTPEEAGELLKRARRTDQLGYWALSLFAGMRTVEIKRLEGLSAPWSLVRVADGIIEVPAGYSKTCRRVIQVSPVLREWLKIIRREKIPFYPCVNPAEKIPPLRLEVLRKFRGDGELPGIFNMGRRSYISYRLALPRASYHDIAQTAGNSERMIRRYYRRPVSREAARRYFSLTPAALRVP